VFTWLYYLVISLRILCKGVDTRLRYYPYIAIRITLANKPFV